MTSRSLSGSNLFDYESKKSRGGTESLILNEEAENSNSIENNANGSAADRDSASNTAIASCTLNIYNDGEKNEAQSLFSEKSINPSVTAMAGSIK